MKKLLLLSLAALFFAACETKTPEPEPNPEPTVENRGVIVGTLGCRDMNWEYDLYGYFVLINPDSTSTTYDAYLAFNLELPYPIGVRAGTWLITEVALPYDFTYKIVEYGDEGYTEFMPYVDYTDHWTPFRLDCEQVIIYPKK